MKISIIFLLLLSVSILAIAQDQLQIEIKTSTSAFRGLIAKESILILKETAYGLDVYPMTTDVIKSISSGSIKFRNERAANFSIQKSASPAEISEMLAAIEKAKTPDQMNAVLGKYKPKLRWEEMFADPPSMLELFKDKDFDKDWRIVKSTPLKLVNQEGKVIANIDDVKDIVEFTRLRN